MSLSSWLRKRHSPQRSRTIRYRPLLERLEDRVVFDVGDTLAAALNTHVGPSPGTYAMTSEHLGDGAYGALDVDMYSFKAKAGEALTVATLPAAGGTAMDTVLRLFDSNGNLLTSNDDFGGNLYSRIEDFVFTSSGTYYVGVSGYPNFYYNPAVGGSGVAGSTGDYGLSLNVFTPTPDAAGDTLATAQATNLGPADGGYSANGTIGDGLYLSSDVDLYRFTANAGQVITAVTALPSGGTAMQTVLRLFDASGNQLTYNGYGNGNYSRFEYQLPSAGTYYIGVSGVWNYSYSPTVAGSGTDYSLGDYNLALNLVTPTPDAAGDSLASADATGLTAGTPFSATGKIGDGLYPLQDVDLYQFQATAGQVLSASTSLPTGGTPINDIHVRLFDAGGNQLTAYYNGYDSSARIDYQFSATGTYYIGISGEPNDYYNPNVAGSGTPYYQSAMGDYTLSLALATPAPDTAGDTLATAQVTTLGPGDGTYSATAKIGDGLYPLRDVDLYQFQASAGQLLSASTALPSGGSSVPTVLRLFDASGSPLGGYYVGDGSTLQYQFATAGTYYIGVSGSYNVSYNANVGGSGSNNSRGDYTVNLALATPTADTAGDTLATAQATGLGPSNGTFSAAGKIGDGLYPLRDVDLYQVQAAAGQGLIASTAYPSGGQYLYTMLRLFDATGHQIGNTTYGYGTTLRYQFATAGTYYIGISGYFNNGYDPTAATPGGAPVGNRGDYQLNLSLVTATMDAEGDTLATALGTGFGPVNGTYSHNASIGDNFFGNADVDLYGFSANAGQRFSAAVAAVMTNGTPLSDCIPRLFDSAGHQLWLAYSYYGIQNYTFAVSGTYYIGVSGAYNSSYDPNTAGSGYPAYWTGDYSLTLSLVTPIADAEGDTIATAYASGLGPTAGSFTRTAHIGDGLYPQDDVDLYQVNANALQLLRISTAQPAGGTLLVPVVRLFDASGNELAEADGSYWNPNVTLEYQFTTAGTYYIGISGSYNRNYNANVANSGYQYASTGDYTLNLTLITPTPDGEGDTIASAVATGLGTADGSYSHQAKIGDGLYFSKDVDLYQFNAVAGQVITIRTSVTAGGTPFDPYLRIFDASGNEIANGADVLQFTIPTAGRYYVGVSGYPNSNYDPNVAGSGAPPSWWYGPSETGDYVLNLTLVTPTADAVGDTIANALNTQLGPNASTYIMPRTTIGDGLYVGFDVDMYQFRVQAGQVLTASTSLPSGGTPVDTVLTLFDAAGNLLAQVGSLTGNSDSQLQYTFPSKGTYYIGVSAGPNYYYDPNTAGSGSIGGYGTYTLTLDIAKLVNAPTGGGGQHVQQVTGHAVYSHTVGLPSGGQNINQVTINAWLDSGGVAHGTMSWTTTDQTLPGGGGQQRSGWPYIMRVDMFIIIGNTAHIEGVVVRSGQQPAAIGQRVSWDLVINSDGTDLLNGNLVDKGNFTIH